MLSHSGRVRRDSLDDSAFIAFSISMTTKLEDLSVRGFEAGRQKLTWKARWLMLPWRCHLRIFRSQLGEIERSTGGSETR